MKEVIVEFGQFRLFPRRRRLEVGGKTVALGSREIDMLLTLVESEGEIVTQADLIKAVWQGRSIAETSVRVHLSGLRKAFAKASPGSEFIATVPGRGYTFVGPSVRTEAELAELGANAAKAWIRPLPSLITEVIGREDVIDAIAGQLHDGRLITITGFAGIGKTTVALAVASATATQFEDGACFIDLSAIDRPGLIPTSIAVSLGIGVNAVDPMIGVLSHLRDRETLFVIDNCEHLIDEAAHSIIRLLEGTSRTTVIATSREVLNVQGERVHRLKPLRLPVSDTQLPGKLASVPSVALFMARIRASVGHFALDETSGPVVARLCRELEGIPLALEFAASRVQEFGLAEVASRLNDRFSLLSKGRRTAAARHRTLRATIDWSFALLAKEEGEALGALSVFSDSFTLASAVRVISGKTTRSDDEESRILALSSKSLLYPTLIEGVEHYRMLEMTREFAREKLELAGGGDRASHRHALDCLDVLAEAESRWEDGESGRWLGMYRHKIGDVRRAIEWANSRQEHSHLAIKLTADAAILFISQGLMTEYLGHLRCAISSNETVQDAVLEGRLYCSLGNVVFHTMGLPGREESRDAFMRSAEIASQSGDYPIALRATSALSAVYISNGEYDRLEGLEESFGKIPGGPRSLVENRTLAHANFYLGNFHRSAEHIEAFFASLKSNYDVKSVTSTYDQRQIVLRTTEAMVHWMSGRADTALRIAMECVEYARSGSNAVSYCQTLANAACPLSFVISGSATALPLAHELTSLAERHSLTIWVARGRGYRLKMRPAATGDQAYNQLDPCSPDLGEAELDYFSILGDGHVDDWVFESPRSRSVSWCSAELLRGRGEIAVRAGKQEVAMGFFEESMSQAIEQDALPWRLRTAMSKSKLLRAIGKAEAARDALEGAMSLFTEGFDSIDFVRAKALLIDMSSQSHAEVLQPGIDV